jgi:hypothetical protein
MRKSVYLNKRVQKNSRKLEDARQVTRRDLFEKLGYGTLVAAMGLCLTASSSSTEDDSSDNTDALHDELQKYMQISSALERSKLGTVKWNHPDNGPSNPMFVVPYTHSDHQGKLVNSSHIESLRRELQILLFLADQGCQDFATEGYSSEEKSRPVKTYKDANGYITPVFDLKPLSSVGHKLDHLESRRIWQNQNIFTHYFKDLSSQQSTPEIGRIFAGCVPESVTVRGAEDSAILSRLLHLIDEELGPRQKRLQEFLDAYNADGNKDGVVNMSLNVNQGKGIVLYVNKQEFDANLVVTDIEGQLQGEINNPIHRKREEFVVNSLGADVVLFGSDHLPHFLAISNPKRSIGVITHGLGVEYGVDSETMENGLQQIKHDIEEGLNKVKSHLK